MGDTLVNELRIEKSRNQSDVRSLLADIFTSPYEHVTDGVALDTLWLF